MLKDKETDCNIILDLLPLYVEDICSEQSKKLIEEHITGCKTCKEMLDNYKQDTGFERQQNLKDMMPLQNAKKILQKNRMRIVKKCFAAVTIAAVIVLCIIYSLFFMQLGNVSKESYDVSGLCLSKEQHTIAFILRIPTNDAVSFKYVNKGDSLYLECKKSLLFLTQDGIERDNGESYCDYVLIDTNGGDEYKSFTKLYLGTPEDNICLWDQTLTIPAANYCVEQVISGEFSYLFDDYWVTLDPYMDVDSRDTMTNTLEIIEVPKEQVSGGHVYYTDNNHHYYYVKSNK